MLRLTIAHEHHVPERRTSQPIPGLEPGLQPLADREIIQTQHLAANGADVVGDPGRLALNATRAGGLRGAGLATPALRFVVVRWGIHEIPNSVAPDVHERPRQRSRPLPLPPRLRL